MFSFFSPFPFLRILGLWVIGLLLGPIGLALIAFVLLLAFRNGRIVCVLCLIGLAYLRFAQLASSSALPNHDAFVFQINQDPTRGPKSWIIPAKVISVHQHRAWIPVHTQSMLYVQLLGFSPRVGQVYLAYGNLNPIRSSILPGAMDWRSYYARKGIYTSSFLALERLVLVQDAAAQHSIVTRLRDHAKGYLQEALPEGVHRNVAEAMFLGIGSTIDFETRQSYAALGAIHILSVSGMHVGLLYMGLQLLLGFLLRFRRYGPPVYFTLIMLVLWTFAAMTGFSAPVLRSAWMFSVLLFAQIFRLHSHPLNVWAFSCFVLLVIQPNQLFQVGFQLSYAAVLGLIFFQNKLVNCWKPKYWLTKQIWELTCLAISAQLLTWPLVIFYFHQFPNPLYFFLLNPILVGLSSLTLCIGFLYLILAPLISPFSILFSGFGHIFLASFELLHGLMFSTTQHLSAVISFIRLNEMELASYYLCLGLLVFWWKSRRIFGLYLSLATFASLLIVRFFEPLREEAYMTVAENQVVFLRTNAMRGQSYGAPSPVWLQSNVGAWWARNQVVDTLTHNWPVGSIRWQFNGETFVYLKRPGVQQEGHPVHLLLSAELDLQDPRFLKSWQGSIWYFVRRPSRYRLAQLKPYWPKQVYYLSEQAALHFP